VQVASRFSAELEDLGYVRRTHGGEYRAVVDLAFTLPPPQGDTASLEELTLGNGDVAAVMLRDVRQGMPQAESGAQGAQQRREQIASVEYRAVLQDYVNRADVERRPLGEQE
jgi:hypothetical protein